MRILVAGGAGYIGSVLVPRLVDRGYEVTVVDQCWFGNHLPKEIDVVDKDVMDLTEYDLSLKSWVPGLHNRARYDAVVFLAGLSNDPMAEYSPRENFIQNAAAPAYLAYIAKRAEVKRFIHGGSCSVYGYTVNQLYDETCPAVSKYPYGISKLQGEFASLQLANGGFSVIGLRKGTVGGYSPRMRLDLVVNSMFRGAVKDNIIRVNNPSIWRPILSIRDAVEGYIRALEAAPEISGIFNLASGNYTIGAIGDYVAEGVKEYLGIDAHVLINNVQDFRNYKVSWEKARDVLGFHPRSEIKDIVKDLADNIDNFSDMDDERYYNIRTFKSIQAINGRNLVDKESVCG